jgi:DNA repair exonuclease SbcCD nuclease subunit
MKNRRLFFVGDIHGEFREMIWKATQQYGLRGADLVVLGDFGIGFDGRLKYDYGRAVKKMEEYDIEVFSIRGNHDNPKYFKDDPEMKTLLEETYPKIHFLADHRVYKIGGKDIYTIGGGGSTDIKFRTPGKTWWEGEYIEEKPVKELPGRVDIIISHEAPLTFEPVISRFEETPEEQYQKILAGRKYLETVLKEVRCEEWYYGHYHQHYSGSYGEVLYKGLAISEFYEERIWED